MSQMRHIPQAGETISYEEILHFYQWAGVSDAVAETAINRLEQVPKAAIAPETKNAVKTAAQSPAQAPAPIPSEIMMSDAREQAKTAPTLEALQQILAAFDGCPLKFTAKNTCFADGTPQSPLMLIGEAPGRDEDIEGKPFVGRAGKLLNLMLKAIGLERDAVYIANTIPWRPPGNRTPTPLETELCRPFIERQIELAHPQILLALGGPATKFLTGEKDGIMKLRGRWFSHQTAHGMTIPVMATLHPAYLLRTPSHKKFAWVDFLEVKMRLRSLNAL